MQVLQQDAGRRRRAGGEPRDGAQLTPEGATPSGVTIAGGIHRTNGDVRGRPCSLFGCNTTPGGDSFHDLFAFGATRFDFATPISHFGGYFGGMQKDFSSIRVFLTGGPQDIPFSFDLRSGGTGFYGFSSTQSVSRVDVVINVDFVGMDDVMYGPSVSVVPEPSTYALMAAGLAALGLAARRRRIRAQARRSTPNGGRQPVAMS